MAMTSESDLVVRKSVTVRCPAEEAVPGVYGRRRHLVASADAFSG